jgi:hypothetical protein
VLLASSRLIGIKDQGYLTILDVVGYEMYKFTNLVLQALAQRPFRNKFVKLDTNLRYNKETILDLISNKYMSTIDNDLADVEAMATAHQVAQNAQDVSDLGAEVRQAEVEALAEMARAAAPAFADLDLCDTCEEWVPGEYLNEQNKVIASKKVARKYLSFQIGEGEAQRDGTYLYEIRALYLTADGRVELLSTLGQSTADEYHEAGTFYGQELNALPDTELAPEKILAARNRHLLAPWNTQIAALGVEFDTSRVMKEMQQSLERANAVLATERRSLEQRASRLSL